MHDDKKSSEYMIIKQGTSVFANILDPTTFSFASQPLYDCGVKLISAQIHMTICTKHTEITTVFMMINVILLKCVH
jgi:hypothetical protein